VNGRGGSQHSVDPEVFERALGAAAMAVWSWTAEKDQLTFSASIRDLLRIEATASTPESLSALLAFVDAEDRNRVREAFETTSVEPFHVECRVARPGQVLWLAFDGQRRDANTRVLDGVCREVTEQRLIEERWRFLGEASEMLASSLDYERTLAEIARLVVPRLADWCSIDIADPRGVLRRLAAAHVDPAKEALAIDVTRRYPPRRESTVGIYQVLRTGEAVMMSEFTEDMLRSVTVDEEHFAMIRSLGLHSYICAPLATRSATFGVMTFVTAESGRTYTDEDLAFARQLAARATLAIENARMYREARAATDARDFFMATLSHEMRTPMTSISGWVQMLRQGNHDAEMLGTALESIEQSAKVQARLVDDLLDISRVIAGKLRIDSAVVDMNDVARDTVNTLQPAAANAQVQVMFTLPRDGEAMVEGDFERLQQVLWNLLSNAIKFSPRGGLVRLSATTDEDSVTVDISDTGRGIGRGLLPYIFEPFRQGEEMQARAGGLGLGLAIVRNLVHLHGGRVSAESDGEGKGAVFTVSLPRVR
jgi:signal transduction histidine kinase